MSAKNIVIDGVSYAPVQTGNRAVIVVDRGWVFAGDVTEKDGRIARSMRACTSARSDGSAPSTAGAR